ncbi:hypothetical protein GGX14DRAFT_398703 [Mycena pura]|uniref:Uncharacterized protein n=1 Tax=Mycena pura TaxID=153505 RepID=A0AAD6V9L2_9AGAR|nr:hypothetical protein GGX14DRAFT_398703 [Mycena pura]
MQLSFKLFAYVAAAMAINVQVDALGSASSPDVRGETFIQPEPEVFPVGTICSGPSLNGTCLPISISATGSCTSLAGEHFSSLVITRGFGCTFYFLPNCVPEIAFGPVEAPNPNLGGWTGLTGLSVDKNLTCFICNFL